MPPASYAAWLGGFLPQIPVDGSGGWLQPAIVTDRERLEAVVKALIRSLVAGPSPGSIALVISPLGGRSQIAFTVVTDERIGDEWLSWEA